MAAHLNLLAAALASYARQAEDTTLEHHAARIRARAIRRAGELLNAIQPQPGKRTDKPRAGTDSRSEAARKAGLSHRQQHQAQRVANVPECDFNAQVESDSPPTVTALANQGKRPSPFSREQVRGQATPPAPT